MRTESGAIVAGGGWPEGEDSRTPSSPRPPSTLKRSLRDWLRGFWRLVFWREAGPHDERLHSRRRAR
jgi:hypothetical protein